jgi:predicted transcriptional regulator of viral defense system
MAREGGLGSNEATRRLLRLAERQHGVVSARQLRRLGVSWEQLRDRSDAGWLRRTHQGVYVLAGWESLRRTRWMAAVVACGPGAVLSHIDAAVLWGLRGPVSKRGVDTPIEVTIPHGTNRRRRSGIFLRRTDLAEGEVTVHHRIPVTTAPRTVLDLATRVERRQLERMIDEAERLRLCSHVDLAELKERTAGALASGRSGRS